MWNPNKYLESSIAYISVNSPWTNVYGLSRSIVATGTFLTFLLNPTSILFTKLLVGGSTGIPFYLKFSFFEIFKQNLTLAHIAAIVILFVVMIGWRPRFTAFFHFWITASFMTSTETPDGGDQISTILSFLFIFLSLGDNRKWHWQGTNNNANFYSKAFAYSVILMIKIQVSVIYFHAAVGKLKINEWVNGTAIWYWFHDPNFGMNVWTSFILNPILKLSYGVVLFTWGSIVIEIILFAAFFMTKSKQKKLLYLGIAFHFLIMVIQGLGSFFFAMAGAVIIYLRSTDDPFDLSYFSKLTKKIKLKMNNNPKEINKSDIAPGPQP